MEAQYKELTHSNYIKMKDLLVGYNEIDSQSIWLDFLLNLVFSWPLFLYSFNTSNLYLFIVSMYFLYRGAMLIHEVSHIAKKIPGYRLAYNVFFGWPLSFPAYIFDHHLFHHGKSTYGTEKDPEYKYIESFGLKTLIKPILSSIFLPFFQLIRFGILPIVLIFLPETIKLFIYKKASTLVFDTSYERIARNKEKELKMMMQNDLASAAYKVIILVLILKSILPVGILIYYYIGFFFCSSLNMYRALFNHLYLNKENKKLSRTEHLLDTTTIESGVLTNLIFVNGLNFHTIHHLFPEIPYYRLKDAHKKLIQNLPKDHVYNETVYKSIFDLVWFCTFQKRSHSCESDQSLLQGV